MTCRPLPVKGRMPTRSAWYLEANAAAEAVISTFFSRRPATAVADLEIMESVKITYGTRSIQGKARLAKGKPLTEDVLQVKRAESHTSAIDRM